jgi:DNA-binding CsgD family transcriptional regulator
VNTLLKCIEEGKSVAMICDFFKITQKTLYNWRKCDIESPINDRKTYSKSNKLHDLLRDEIDKNPDATLAEIGAIFGKSPSNIDYHLRKMNITRKKNHALSRAR